jgi:alpha-N-acetylglucosamine transferase
MQGHVKVCNYRRTLIKKITMDKLFRITEQLENFLLPLGVTQITVEPVENSFYADFCMSQEPIYSTFEKELSERLGMTVKLEVPDHFSDGTCFCTLIIE